jgi:flap endonuclease-1
MGVKIKDLVTTSKKVITLTNLTEKRIAIDGFNWIYQFLSVIRDGRGQTLKNNNNVTTSHIVGMIPRNIVLLENHIKPIYVFDGKPNPLKQDEINRRKEIKKIAQKNYEEAYDSGDDTKTKNYAQATSKLTSEMIDDFKEVLTYMGIPTVQAIEDGEAQASYMVQKGDVWGCASQDYDSFLFGANRIVRNLSVGRYSTIRGHKIKNDIEFYVLDDVLKELEITQDQLIDVGILVGLDFYKGIKGIASKTGLKLIKQYDTIENVREQKKNKYDFSTLTDDLIEKVRNIFNTQKTVDDYSLSWNKPNRDKLWEILVEKHNFNTERVKKYLERICKTGKRQVTLDSLFGL